MEFDKINTKELKDQKELRNFEEEHGEGICL